MTKVLGIRSHTPKVIDKIDQMVKIEKAKKLMETADPLRLTVRRSE